MKTKKDILLIILLFVSAVSVETQEMVVAETQNSGCLANTRSGEDSDYDYGKPPTIVLTKEGDILTVEVLNLWENCCIPDIEATYNYYDGVNGEPGLLLASVAPPESELLCDCICPYNVSFTVHDLEPNSFYFSCLWFTGKVELTEGTPLTLTDDKKAVSIDGFSYTLHTTSGAAELTGADSLTGEVHIPSEVSYEDKTYSVTSINPATFRNKTAVTKVVIPRTVVTLGSDGGDAASPFNGCTALEMIEVEEENPMLCAADGVLYDKGKTKLISYPAGSKRSWYVVPESVRYVESLAFAYSQMLTMLTLPAEAVSVGYAAFYQSKSLEGVILPSNIKALPMMLFANCERLREITIPEGVTYIGTAFSGCTSLTSVTLPESVTEVNIGAFYDCHSLKSVILSPNMENIHNHTFENCTSLTNVVIPEGVKGIEGKAFYNCTALRTLDIPESVNLILAEPFGGCSLDTLIIRGILDSKYNVANIFKNMGTQTKVFVQPSEVEKFQAAYRGKVYPLQQAAQVEGVHGEDNTNPSKLYDLSGRRVKNGSGLPKGIYIENGRKRKLIDN